MHANVACIGTMNLPFPLFKRRNLSLKVTGRLFDIHASIKNSNLNIYNVSNEHVQVYTDNTIIYSIIFCMYIHIYTYHIVSIICETKFLQTLVAVIFAIIKFACVAPAT